MDQSDEEERDRRSPATCRSGNMDPDHPFELISAAIDDEADPEELAVVASHLAVCGSCRDHVAAAAQLKGHLLNDAIGPAGGSVAAAASSPFGGPRPAEWGRVGGPAIRGFARRAAHRRRARRLIAAAASLVMLLVATGLERSIGGSGDRPVSSAHRDHGAVRIVSAGEHGFDHATVRVDIGETLKITNDSDQRHVLVQDMGSGTLRTPLTPGEVHDLVYRDVGVFEVWCEVHPDMSMIVRVST